MPIHEIRVLDLDAGRLMILENRVKTAVRRLELRARISMVADNLAITRQGLLDKVPVLEVDGKIVQHSHPMDTPGLIKLLSGLLKHDSAGKSKKDAGL
jgi:hypothetical protein